MIKINKIKKMQSEWCVFEIKNELTKSRFDKKISKNQEYYLKLQFPKVSEIGTGIATTYFIKKNHR